MTALRRFIKWHIDHPYSKEMAEKSVVVTNVVIKANHLPNKHGSTVTAATLRERPPRAGLLHPVCVSTRALTAGHAKENTVVFCKMSLSTLAGELINICCILLRKFRA